MAVEVKSPVSAPVIPAGARVRKKRPWSPVWSPQTDGPVDGLTLTRRTLWLGMGLAAFVAGVHVAVSWGHIPVYWGDSGRWLHEVDRFAHGERAYRDFFWAFPPLAMWLIGGAARIIGSDLIQIFAVTAVLTAVICITWSRFAMPLFGERYGLLAIAVCLPLGIAFTTTQSAPLASGMYTPAAPVGFLCLLLTFLAAISLTRTPSARNAMLLGLCAALCVLAKHDFWLPAAVLLAGAPALTAGNQRVHMYVVSCAAAAAVLLTASAFLVAQNGVAVFVGILNGFGHVQELGGRGIPTLETLTLEATTAALCVAVVALAVGVTREDKRRRALWIASIALGVGAMLTGVWLTQALWIARFGTPSVGERLGELSAQFAAERWGMLVLFKNVVKLLRERLTLHAIPTLLPFIVLALCIRYRAKVAEADRRLLIVLLLAAVALRLRRGMEHTEWTSILVELPIYAYTARVFLGDTIERWYGAGKLVLVSLALLFVWQHVENGYGPFTKRGTRVAVETPRGTVRLASGQALHYKRLQSAIDQLDPSGRRPILSFGYSGGFNYFLERPAASPLTHGFRLSSIRDPNVAVRILRSASPPMIAVDNPYFDDRVPIAGIQILSWRPRTRVNHYVRYDRPYFNAAVAGCRLQPTTMRQFTIYDCPERNGAVAARVR